MNRATSDRMRDIQTQTDIHTSRHKHAKGETVTQTYIHTSRHKHAKGETDTDSHIDSRHAAIILGTACDQRG